MIRRSLVRKSVDESRWLLLACLAVLFPFCWIHVFVTSRVDMRRFERILDNIPEAWESLAPVPFADMLSYPARVAVVYEEPLLLILMAVWCITRSSNSVSGEIDRGTMEITLSQPVRRREVFWSHALVTMLGIVLIAVVCWMGTACGIATTSIEQMKDPLSIHIPVINWRIPIPQLPAEPATIPMRQVVDKWLFAPICINYFAVGFLVAGVGTLFSSWDRYRWRTIGLTAAFYVLSMLAEILGQSVEEWQLLKQLSIFSAYEPVKQAVSMNKLGDVQWALLDRTPSGEINGLGAMGASILLISLGCVAFAVAARIFSRRNVPAPI